MPSPPSPRGSSSRCRRSCSGNKWCRWRRHRTCTLRRPPCRHARRPGSRSGSSNNRRGAGKPRRAGLPAICLAYTRSESDRPGVGHHRRSKRGRSRRRDPRPAARLDTCCPVRSQLRPSRRSLLRCHPARRRPSTCQPSPLHSPRRSRLRPWLVHLRPSRPSLHPRGRHSKLRLGSWLRRRCCDPSCRPAHPVAP